MSIPTDILPKLRGLQSTGSTERVQPGAKMKRAAELAALRILCSLRPRLLGIGAALQSWTIVVRVGVGILLLSAFLLLFRARTQARLARLVVLHLAGEHDVA